MITQVHDVRRSVATEQFARDVAHSEFFQSALCNYPDNISLSPTPEEHTGTWQFDRQRHNPQGGQSPQP